jgi:hypothetical protein
MSSGKREKSMAKRTAAKRKLINTGTDNRYVRRNQSGRFKESDDVGRSLAQDRQRKAKTKSKPGQGDKGDR